jgi:hypothetical protein
VRSAAWSERDQAIASGDYERADEIKDRSVRLRELEEEHGKAGACPW